MSIVASYLDDLSRVRVTCSGAPATADYALIERSTDGGITWSTVRGGDTVSLLAGGGVLDDYEFAPGVDNVYRASYVDTGLSTFVGSGAVVTADNAAVSPPLPAGIEHGDLLVLVSSTRGSGVIEPIDGWLATVTSAGQAFRVFTRRFEPGDIAPTVTVTGGAAGDDTMGRVLALRNAADDAWAYVSNGSVQDIAMPSLFLPAAQLVVRVGWKRSTSTGAAMAGWNDVGFDSSSAGAGASHVYFWNSYISGGTIPAGTVTMTGGVAAVSRAATIRFVRPPWMYRETTTIAPAMDRIWLKNPQRPYLNRPVTVVDWSDVERPARSGVFDVVGRSYPVAVTELRGSRRYTLGVTVTDLAQAADLDGCLSAGEPVLIHVPAGCPVPGMYAVVGNTQARRPAARRSVRRYFDLPLTEVAAPAGTLVGGTVTWQGVLNAFATWADVIAAEPTWSDLLDRIGTPADVVVP